jgi:hypothetical protein
MANSAKPVKKSTKLGGKKLEKKTTLTRAKFLTRLPIA